MDTFRDYVKGTKLTHYRDFDRFSYRNEDLEAQERNAYFEAHWPGYRDKSINNLKESLSQKEPLKKIPLKDGRLLEIREGAYKDADDINMRDHQFYSTIGLAICKEKTSKFGIASFSENPLEPIGFYFLMNYFEDDPYWTKKDHDEQKYVGESKLVYISPRERGQDLGKILTLTSALELIDNPVIEILRFEVAKEKVGNLLNKLGFRPIGKVTYDYDDYKIELNEREKIKSVFQSALNDFVSPVASDCV